MITKKINYDIKKINEVYGARVRKQTSLRYLAFQRPEPSKRRRTCSMTPSETPPVRQMVHPIAGSTREEKTRHGRRTRRDFSAPGAPCGDLNSTKFHRLRNRRGASGLNASPLTWFSVVGMMSGVCGSIVVDVLACLASSSNQSGLPARAAGDIIEIGDGRSRKENTLTGYTL